MVEFVPDRVENNVGKGANADYQYFLFFPHCFQDGFSPGLLKLGIVWERVKGIDTDMQGVLRIKMLTKYKKIFNFNKNVGI